MTSPTIKTVTLTDGSSRIKLSSDYNAQLVKRCRQLNGKWDSTNKAWYFAPDLSDSVRQMCLDIYGIDPLADAPADLVNVRFVYNSDGAGYGDHWLFGREILRRPGRDSAVQPGSGVSILSGGFSSHGGSRANPRLGDADEGTVLLIRDVPRTTALAFQAENEEGVVTILEPEAQPNLHIQEAKAAAATLAGLLKKLSKDEQDIIIHQLVSQIQEVAS